MRWTSQTIAVFGLLALFTFQVENSSAATLRGLKTEVSAHSASLSVDEGWAIAYEESEAIDLVEDLVGHRKERLEKLRESVRQEIEKLKEGGVGAVAKDVALRVKARLAKIREVAKKIADILGEETTIGAAAKQVVKHAEEALAKLREMVRGKDNTKEIAEDDGGLLDISEEDFIEGFMNHLRYCFVQGYKNMVTEGRLRPKDELERLREELKMALNTGKEALLRYPQNKQLCATANDLVTVAEKTLKKMNDIIDGKVDETDKGEFDLDDFKYIEAVLSTYQMLSEKRAKILNEVGDMISKEELLGFKDDLTSGLNVAVAVTKRHPKNKELVAKATKVVQNSETELKKINELLNKVQDDDVAYVSMDLLERVKERVQKLREAVRQEIEKLKEGGVGAVAKDVAMRVKARLAKMREVAKKIADILGEETTIGAAAKKVVHDVEEALAKLRERICGQGETPKPFGL